MIYTDLFRQMREARNLTHERIAELAHCHRNTVINVERGRPVKFATIAKLMRAMKCSDADLRCMAILWIERTSGLDLSSSSKAGDDADKARAPVENLLAQIRESAKKLTLSDLEHVAWAARSRPVISILRTLKDPAFYE